MIETQRVYYFEKTLFYGTLYPSMNTDNEEVKKAYDKPITPRATDYSEWYLDIIRAAELADYSPVKGCMVIRPYGYALWERVQHVLDAEFKARHVDNAYFPMLIPQRLLEREKEHVEGFAPEVAVVTHAGGEKLDEPLVLRPTSETIMYEVFKDWVHSYRDLPLLINQWANVIRWEKRTKPFLRTTEFLWQEGHTVHATEAEADKMAREMQGVYEAFARDYMAIPTITGRKSESEKFAGALHTYTCEAMMQDGKALQFATSHNLGDHFAKAFDIQYLDEHNTSQYGWQTSWGLSTRSIGGLIMTHSDDKGLVLPPKMASLRVVIIPIYKEDSRDTVLAQANILASSILAGSTWVTSRQIVIDTEDKRPGEKHFHWEKKGVPVRIEIGPKDIETGECVLVRRDTSEKKRVLLASVATELDALLNHIQESLLARAQTRLQEHTKEVGTWEEFVTVIEAGNFVLASYDGTAETEKEIKEKTGATVRCIPPAYERDSATCILTGTPSVGKVIFAKAY